MAFAAPSPSFFKDSRPSPLWSGGPAPGCLHEFPMRTAADQGRQHTTQPITTGTSVLGIRFNGGVMIAADTLGSYGSLSRFRSVSRVIPLTKECVMGCSGDIADMQELKSVLESWIILDESMQYPYKDSAHGLFSVLTRVMYHRRSQMNPYWNHLVIAGVDDGEFLLGVVDKLGVAYQAPVVGTGYGAHLALPLMRSELEKTPGGLSKEQARNLLVRCMRLLFYRDCRASSKFEIATVTAEGQEIEGPLTLDTDWSIAHMVQGFE
ncbi:proteasome subunit beta type-4-like [Sycon ciliatum]|uniref:proteasome subunit beta type-4-like n=1 Tax=Sycon ciliatum TaxID=27933 RepID=UPI0020AC05DB|eukprot:scpid88175/ scgid12163/ Proteasome subunit beta type-4; 26 kDa prosomal protein; Macropain beta chain; Multicatalytic endopeptidase complex beta chain; Proteasome chain 3